MKMGHSATLYAVVNRRYGWGFRYWDGAHFDYEPNAMLFPNKYEAEAVIEGLRTCLRPEHLENIGVKAYKIVPLSAAETGKR